MSERERTEEGNNSNIVLTKKLIVAQLSETTKRIKTGIQEASIVHNHNTITIVHFKV
jgi:hypothetical protein